MDKAAKANISDTQTATFNFKDLQVVWQHRTWGHSPDPAYPWAAFLYGDKGTLKLSVNSYDFIPQQRGADAVHQDVVMELDQYPEDRMGKDLERHVAPAIRGHMVDFQRNRKSRKTRSRHRARSYFNCQLHPCQHVHGTGPSIVMGCPKGRNLKDAEANQKLARAYRSPWNHPFG